MVTVLLLLVSTLETITIVKLLKHPATHKILGTDVSGSALAITRVAGFVLLLFGIACWPRVEATIPRLLAMLIYNVLTTVYLGYLRLSSESVGILLLPAIAVHAVLAILFVGAWLKHLTT